MCFTKQEKYDQLELAQTCSQAGIDSQGSEESVGNNLSLWLEASGGPKGGRILGMSSLSRTQRLVGTSSSTSALTTQVNTLTDEVSHLKEIISQRDQERVQRDLERANLEKDIREMRRQQEFIMQHLQLSSAQCQNPPNDDDDDAYDDNDDGGDDF